MCVCILQRAFYKPSPVVGTDVAKTLICTTGTTCEWKHTRVRLCLCTRMCVCLTERLTLGWVFFFGRERTRAKGVVAKEAWGDYKDLGL